MTGTVVQIGTLVVRLGEARTPAQLPSGVAGFVGREPEIAAVVRAATPPGRLAGAQLTGRPGVGKTALAVEAARALRGRYPDGQVAAALHGHDGAAPPSGHELVGRLLRSLDVPDRSIAPAYTDRLAHYRAVLAERQVLLVLDDAPDPHLVRDVLPPPGPSFVIVTSRRTLTGLGPRVANLRVDDLPTGPAARLLAAARPGAPAAATDALVTLCAGLPLALRIVAARLRLEPDLDPDVLARQLAGGLDALTAGDRAVRASFDLSYARLSPPARATFRRCAALALPDLPPSAVVALSGLDEETARSATAELAAAHLLDGGPRHRFHDLLRRYAAQLLAAEEEPEQVRACRDRLAQVMLADLRRVVATPDVARPWFGAEWENLLAVTTHIGEADPDALQEVADLILSEHDLHTPWDGWSAVQEAALRDAVRRDLPVRRARLQGRLAVAFRERMLLPLALERLDGALEQAERGDDPVAAAFAVHAEAEIRRDRGEYGRAGALYDRAVAMLAGSTGTEAVELRGWAWHGLGDVRRGQGSTAAALGCQRRALAWFDAAGNAFGRAWAWHGIGDALRDRGRDSGAVLAYQRALDTFSGMGNVASAGWTQQRLGEALLETGRTDEAGRLFARARAAARIRMDPHAEAWALDGLAQVAARFDDPDAAALLTAAAADLMASFAVRRGSNRPDAFNSQPPESPHPESPPPERDAGG